MAAQTQELKARVEPELKAAFASRAKAANMTESQLLRKLIFETLEQDSATSAAIAPATPSTQDSCEIERITVRLAAFLMDAARERAKAQGMAPSRWIAALVQSNLADLPVLTEGELAAVLAANRELAAVGRNINQIARSLNDAFYETDRVKLEKLVELADTIAANRLAVRELVRVSRQAWGVTEQSCPAGLDGGA